MEVDYMLKMNANKSKVRLNLFLYWLISMIVYGALMLVMSKIFKHTIHLDYSMYGLWSFLLAIVIYLLNKLVKPFIFYVTLPITGITMGLFYPFINVIILNIADLLLGNHFDIYGLFMTCFVAILLGLLNMLFDKILLKPLFGKEG